MHNTPRTHIFLVVAIVVGVAVLGFWIETAEYQLKFISFAFVGVVLSEPN